MSEVVKLDAAKRSRGSGARRRRRSKTALVLGGGGFTGAVYEIGALRAFDLLAVNRTVNDFDVYVGTSAGSFVGSAVANGVTPEEMMRVLNKHLPSPLRDMDLGMLLRPNYKGFATAAVKLPFRVAGVARDVGRAPRGWRGPLHAASASPSTAPASTSSRETTSIASSSVSPASINRSTIRIHASIVRVDARPRVRIQPARSAAAADRCRARTAARATGRGARAREPTPSAATAGP